MSALENTILRKIHALDEERKRTVLAFVEQLEADAAPSAEMLLRLPPDERSRILAAQIALAAQEDFEIFAADDLLNEDDPYGDTDAR